MLPENSAVDLPTHQWTEASWVWEDPRFTFNPIDVDEFGSRLAVTRREHAETQFGNTTFGFAVCTKTQHLTSNATDTDEWYKLAMAQLDSLVARPVTISTGKSHKQSFQVSLLVGLSSQLMQTTTQADQLRQLLLSTLRQALPPSAVTRVDMTPPNFADRRLLATEGLIVSVNVTLPREDTTTAYTQLMAMVADSGVAGLAQQMRAADALDASPLGMSAVLESTMVIPGSLAIKDDKSLWSMSSHVDVRVGAKQLPLEHNAWWDAKCECLAVEELVSPTSPMPVTQIGLQQPSFSPKVL